MTNTTSTLYPDLKGSDRVWIECDRCDGAGTVSWGANINAEIIRDGAVHVVHRVCFKCNGVGGRNVLVRSLRAAARRRARAAEKQEADRLARLAAAEAERAAVAAAFAEWRDAHPDVVAAVAAIRGAFGDSLREQLAAETPLTDRQAAAALRVAAEQAADVDATPVVEGRGPITGRLVSVRLVDNDFGSAYKARVRDDRGFTVYGTLPAALVDALRDAFYAADDDEHDTWMTWARGRRVTFTATVTRSRDDATFGFYSRPTKAALA